MYNAKYILRRMHTFLAKIIKLLKITRVLSVNTNKHPLVDIYNAFQDNYSDSFSKIHM